MAKSIGHLFQARFLRHWQQQAKGLETASLAELRDKRQSAARLRQHLDKVIRVADERLFHHSVAANAFPKPVGTEWAWRPALWRQKLPTPGESSVSNQTRIGEEGTLFHDCSFSELTLRQIRNTRDEDLAAFGLQMDVFKFDGSFLSLAIDLPKDAIEGLTKSHLLRVDAMLESESPLELFFRLNIKHGPNMEQIVRELPQDEKRPFVEFDMAYTQLNEKRIESGWLDVIFDKPDMNQITLRDLTFARYRRAAV